MKPLAVDVRVATTDRLSDKGGVGALQEGLADFTRTKGVSDWGILEYAKQIAFQIVRCGAGEKDIILKLNTFMQEFKGAEDEEALVKDACERAIKQLQTRALLSDEAADTRSDIAEALKPQTT